MDDDGLGHRGIQPLDLGKLLGSNAWQLVPPLDERDSPAARRLLVSDRIDACPRLVGPVGSRLDHAMQW